MPLNLYFNVAAYERSEGFNEQPPTSSWSVAWSVLWSDWRGVTGGGAELRDLQVSRSHGDHAQPHHTPDTDTAFLPPALQSPGRLQQGNTPTYCLVVFIGTKEGLI